MKLQRHPTMSTLGTLAAVALMAALPAIVTAQEKSAETQRTPAVEDWSTHHVVFSNPGSYTEGTQTRSFVDWYKIQNNPRFNFTRARRRADRARTGRGSNNFYSNSNDNVSSAEDALSLSDFTPLLSRAPKASGKPKPVKPQGDWNIFLGGTTGAGLGVNFYPAKYSFDINATPSCANDYVVVPVNKATAAAGNATGSVTIATTPTFGDTLTIGSRVYGFHTNNVGCVTGQSCVQINGTTGTATNLANAINGTSCFALACPADPDVSGAAGGATVTLTALAAFSGAAGNGITLLDTASTRITESGVTLTGGTDGQATIVAYNNLYDAVGAAASQSGTVSSNIANQSAGGTVTINGVTLTASSPVAATGLVTLVNNPTNGADVYIQINGATNQYAFHTAGNCGSARACVLIGANTTASATNLKNAVAGSCQNTCSADAYVTATSSANVVALAAITAGTSGNAITLSVTNGSANVTVSGATLGTGTGTVAGSNGVASGTTFTYWSGNAPVSTSQLATNIAAAINANGTLSPLVTATTNTNQILLTADSAGSAGNSITTTDALTGFSWAGATLTGGVSSGLCGTGQPTVKWAYDASTAASKSPMLGSPILSLDGTKVALIESATTGAILHVLRPGTGSGQQGDTTLVGIPVAPTISTSTGSTWTSCLATTNSCMFNLALGSSNDTNSPPFYDYLADDALYVGDNGGVLWKITGVFSGTPAKAAAPWATGVTVHSGSALTGPVYDYGHSNIIAADAGGRVSLVSSAGVVGTNFTVGAITDPPMVDSTTGKVLIFSGGNGAASVVTQRDTTLATGNVTVSVGSSTSATSQIHVGVFDDKYYSSANGVGNLYICGKAAGGGPALYSVPLTTGGVLTSGTPANGPLSLSSSATGQCSPLTEIANNGTDWLFVGIPANCAFGGSATGCIMSFDISSAFPAAANATGAENGGTSGMVADNVSSSGGASSVYFTTLTAPGGGGCTGEPAADNSTCVVKRTQNGLQ